MALELRRVELSRTGSDEPGAVQYTDVLPVKLLPAIDTRRGGPPITVDDGARLLMVGGALTVNVAGEELTPSALQTVMLSLPAAAIYAAGTVTAQLVAPQAGEIARGEEFHSAVDALEKPVPVMVTARSPCPAVAAETERLLIAGAGFTVNAAGFELTLDELTTWMEAGPAVARFAAGMVTEQGLAAQVAPSIAVVVPPKVQDTVDPAAKPVPVMLTARSLWPAVALETDRLEISGVLVHAALRLEASTEPSPVT